MSSNTPEENKTWPQYLAVFTALLAMFSSGLHFGWPSPSLPRLFSSEYPFEVSQEEASYVAVIGPIGDIFGNILASLLVDFLGRKPTILLIGLPQIISMTMIYLSFYSKTLLYFARFIGGLSEGACFTILPIYICEVSEPKIRGALGASFSFSLMLGILFVNIVGSYVDIATAALIYLCFSLVFIATFAPMPESPYFLLMKGRTEAARASLMRLRARDEVEEELTSLTKDVQRQMSERGRFRDLIAVRSNKMATLVMILLRFLQQFSGISSFTMYAQLLVEKSTDKIPPEWGALLLVIVQPIATLIAIFILDLVGRRPLILISVGGCCFTLFVNAVFFTVRDFAGVDVSTVSLIPVVGLTVFIVAFGLGLGSAVNLLGGELFPTTVKAKAICIMNLVLSFCMFAATKFYQFTADGYSLAVPFWVFGVIELVGLVICFKMVPETKNKTLEQIQQEMKVK